MFTYLTPIFVSSPLKENCFPVIMNSLLLFTTIITILCFLNPRLACRAQDINTTTNPCDISGRCGAFSSCYAQDSPICSCLHGFDPIDRHEWDSGNWTRGCQRRVPLGCTRNGTSSNNSGDGFLTLEGVKLSGYSDRWFGPESECGSQCLSNCSCEAYGYHSDFCMFWRGILFDIQRFNTQSGYQLHIRVASSELGRKKNKKVIIIIVSLVVVGLVIISVCGFIFWKCMARRRDTKTSITQETFLSVSTASSQQEAICRVNLEEYPLFEFEVLANATNNFSYSNELGRGGFGCVYKGILADGREIAVKRLSKASGQGLQEFMNEVVLISKLQHRNLVRLLGCCIENKENMLIYEFMPNKSLDVFLFDQTEETLDWRKRANVINGICRGLLYLHRDSRLRIIHRDLKPSNILLDNNWNPRISDFGMARIYGNTQHHVSTARVVGTYGYMAPEYAMEGRFSEKSDVFSFGVMILEIATGRRNKNFDYDGGSMNLLGHMSKLWGEDNVGFLIDSRISSPSYRAEVMRCIHIGLLCVQELAVDRPSISAVLSMLNSETVELPYLREASFSLRSNRSNAFTSSSQSSEKTNCSLNNLTLTLIDGR